MKDKPVFIYDMSEWTTICRLIVALETKLTYEEYLPLKNLWNK
jgi:hypothetical protein